ncbi:stress response protein NST1 [Andrographis paniculata]|uniref:stress response protein NST1 n=1 Tax=Andrographis paniculata TaxID=175694 RepID=UPI0021E95E0C|nr:stress response protein NST1 [Andrographis paniculata]
MPMLSCPLKLPAYRLPVISTPRCIIPNLAYAIEHPSPGLSFGNKISPSPSPSVSLLLFGSFVPQYSCQAMHKDNKDVHPKSINHGVVESCKGRLQSHSSTECADSQEDEQIGRKRKSCHGNKGRVPWNKGRKHTEETRMRIRQRTKEALNDPQVRKKMSEAPRILSDQTRVKIRASLTRLWDKRLRQKRAPKKFLQSWAEAIAEAAKVGGPEQTELEWDSYIKLKQEMARIQICRAAERAEAKEAARARAERAAQLRAERTAWKRRQQEEKEEAASVPKRKRKSKEEKEKLAEFQELKLKERLMKIRRKKSRINRVSNVQRRWEKFDLGEFPVEVQQQRGARQASTSTWTWQSRPQLSLWMKMKG